jgi:hypothetical protein
MAQVSRRMWVGFGRVGAVSLLHFAAALRSPTRAAVLAPSASESLYFAAARIPRKLNSQKSIPSPVTAPRTQRTLNPNREYRTRLGENTQANQE